MEGKDSSYVYMYASLHDLLTFNLLTKNHDGMHRERIVTLEHQIEALQIDEDDDDEDGSEESARDRDKPEGMESDA